MEEVGNKTEVKPLKDPETGLFAKGNPGGPGRPKGSYSLVEAIRRKLEEIPEGKDKTYGEYFIEQVMKKTVVEGDVAMMRDILNRVDGMPKQETDITSKGERIMLMPSELIEKHDALPRETIGNCE